MVLRHVQKREAAEAGFQPKLGWVGQSCSFDVDSQPERSGPRLSGLHKSRLLQLRRFRALPVADASWTLRSGAFRTTLRDSTRAH